MPALPYRALDYPVFCCEGCTFAYTYKSSAMLLQKLTFYWLPLHICYRHTSLTCICHFTCILYPNVPFGVCGLVRSITSTLTYTWLQSEELLRDLLSIQVIVELNVAFCERHLTQCLPSEQLTKECTYVSFLC